MIQCENCESSQFLQITQSRLYFEDGCRVTEIEETYECTWCGGTGSYRYAAEDRDGDGELHGDVERLDGRPMDASNVGGCGGGQR